MLVITAPAPHVTVAGVPKLLPVPHAVDSTDDDRERDAVRDADDVTLAPKVGVCDLDAAIDLDLDRDVLTDGDRRIARDAEREALVVELIISDRERDRVCDDEGDVETETDCAEATGSAVSRKIAANDSSKPGPRFLRLSKGDDAKGYETGTASAFRVFPLSEREHARLGARARPHCCVASLAAASGGGGFGGGALARQPPRAEPAGAAR